jgi:hypothetical protein
MKYHTGLPADPQEQTAETLGELLFGVPNGPAAGSTPVKTGRAGRAEGGATGKAPANRGTRSAGLEPATFWFVASPRRSPWAASHRHRLLFCRVCYCSSNNRPLLSAMDLGLVVVSVVVRIRPRRGPLTPPKPHELNLLVTSDGGLLRISPRGRVALQDAHLRSGVRLIARNRSGRRDESGAPMAVVPERYRAALGAGLLDGVSMIFGAELDLHFP